MKIHQYFDIRFIQAIEGHKRDEELGRYTRAYSNEPSLSFRRIISLQGLPVRGQKYMFNYDPFCQVSLKDGFDTSYIVQESGFIEDDDLERHTPYFVISDEYYLEDAIRHTEAHKLKDIERMNWWKEYAKGKRDEIVARFKMKRWELYLDLEK